MPRLRRGDGFPFRRSADLADRGKRMILFPQSCPARSTPQCEANLTSTGCAQVDPELRNFLRFWANQSLHNDGPTAAYAFCYWNMPNMPTTNTTLRLAVYADGEPGLKGLLGENTLVVAFSAADSSIVTMKCGKGRPSRPYPLGLASKTIPLTTAGVTSALNSRTTPLALLRGKIPAFTSSAPTLEIGQ